MVIAVNEDADVGKNPGSLLDALAAFFLAAFAHRLESLFLPLGPFGCALNKFGADQFEHALFGTVPLARAEPDDAGISAVALAEPRSELVEQLLYRSRSFKVGSRLTARMQRVALAERDHFVYQGLRRLRFRHRRDDALALDDRGDQAAQQRPARRRAAFEFVTCYSMSHVRSSPLFAKLGVFVVILVIVRA